MKNDPIKDGELSALYREGARAEPPPALDAAIRAAAREALGERPATSPRPQARWQRWRLPVGAFATLLLTVTLALMVERERARDLGSVPAAGPAAARPEEAAAERPLQATAVTARAQPAAEPRKPAPEIRREALPQAQPAAAEAAAAAVPAAPSPMPIAPPAVGGAAAELRSGVEMLKARPAAEGVMEDRVAPPAPQAKREAKASAPQQRSPEAWLEDIRRLRREGRVAEAQAQLDEFRRSHPDFILPHDLKH